MSKKWTMRDGTQIKLTDMTDSHLKNCIAMLEKSAEEGLEQLQMQSMSFAGMVQGEMASYCADAMVDEVLAMGVDDYLYEYTMYEDLVMELERRERAGELAEIKVSTSLVDKWMSIEVRK